MKLAIAAAAAAALWALPAAADCGHEIPIRIPLDATKAQRFGSAPVPGVSSYEMCIDYPPVLGAPGDDCTIVADVPVAEFVVVPGWVFDVTARSLPDGVDVSRRAYVMTLVADLDCDGEVGLGDFAIFANSFGETLQ